MPTSELAAYGTAAPGSAAPMPGARTYLDGGLRYEQAGLSGRAIAAYQAALALCSEPAERAEAHLRLARVHRSVCDWDAAVTAAREAVRVAGEAGEEDLAAEAMNVEVGVWQLRGEFRDAEALARAALARARAPRVRGILLQNLGAIAAQQGDFGTAECLFSESVGAFEDARYDLGIAIALNNASAAARERGEPQRAVELGRRAEIIARDMDALDVAILAIQNQAHAFVDLQEFERAEMLLGEALGHFSATRNDLRQAECLEIMGLINEARPEHRETAVRCYERARELALRVADRVLTERVAGRLAALA